MLGDTVEKALSSIGVTKDRVERWLGKPCHCKETQEKLNQIHAWAARILLGKTKNANEYLTQLIGDDDESGYEATVGGDFQKTGR